MKRLLTCAALILISTLVITFAFVKRSTAVPLRFNKKDLPQHGLVIVGPSEQEFVQLTTRMANPTSDDATGPYVFVKNTNEKKRVIAYTLKWEMTKEDGTIVSRIRRESREDILQGKEGLIGPDDRTTLLPQSGRFFSLLGYGDGEPVSLKGTEAKRDRLDHQPLMDKLKQSGVLARMNEQLKRTVSVTLSIDAAVFEDGSFVGEDTTGYFERINAQADAKLNIVKEIFRRLKSGGESYEAIMKSFEDRASGLSGYEISPAPDAPPAEVHKYYEKRFLDEIVEMRNGFGSDELALRQFLWVNHSNRPLKVFKSAGK